MNVQVRGEGIAAYCCVHLLRQAGIETSLLRSERPPVPALLLSLPALQLIRDVFSPHHPPAKEPIRKRVVQWDSQLPVAEMDHLGFVTSEQELLGSLLPGDEPVPAKDPDWIVHCENPLPDGVSHLRLGTRLAAARKVSLRSGASDACVMESLAGGWLFLLPFDASNGWLLSVDQSPLEESRIVAPRVEAVFEEAGKFPAYPRIANRLTGSNWIACGSAAMAFDPICGDGTALAVRAAILAAAVIRAMATRPGEQERDALLRHYEARIRAGFGRHVELCRQYYRHGFGGPWWDRELAALNAWTQPAPTDFAYRLVGFDLESTANAK